MSPISTVKILQKLCVCAINMRDCEIEIAENLFQHRNHLIFQKMLCHLQD